MTINDPLLGVEPSSSPYISEDEGFQDTCSNASITSSDKSIPTGAQSSPTAVSELRVTSIRPLNTKKLPTGRSVLPTNLVPSVSCASRTPTKTPSNPIKQVIPTKASPNISHQVKSPTDTPKPATMTSVAARAQYQPPKNHPLDLLVGLLEPEFVEKIQEALKPDFDDIPEMIAISQSHKPQVASWAKKRLILDPLGSVRGRKDNVRNSVQNFNDLIKDTRNETRNFVSSELHTCVVYVTSSGIVRETFSHSKQLMALLDNNRIHYERRDVYISGTFKEELRERCAGTYRIPSMFVNGHLIGGYREVEKINETGLLLQLFVRHCESSQEYRTSPPSSSSSSSSPTTATESVPKAVSVRFSHSCMCCDGKKFVVCQSCRGSGKTYLAHFSSEKITLRCGKCIRTPGLMRCEEC